MYDRILVPTDGSEPAEAAVEHGIDLASRFDSTVLALYVVDAAGVGIAPGSEQAQRIHVGRFGDRASLEARAQAATGDVVERAEARDLPVEAAYRVGVPAQAIVEFADERDVDLVVMGSHRRSGLRRVLKGSVTERVIRNTDRPVLVVGEE